MAATTSRVRAARGCRGLVPGTGPLVRGDLPPQPRRRSGPRSGTAWVAGQPPGPERLALPGCGGRGTPAARGGRWVMSSLLIQLGLAGVLAGVVVTALVRAKRLGDRWDDWGLWAIFGGFGLVMVGVALAITTTG